MAIQTTSIPPPPPPPVLPPPTSDSIVPLMLLNNDTNPPPSWVISTFGPGGSGVPPPLVALQHSNLQTEAHPGWLQNLINNHSSGDPIGLKPISLPMWLLAIVEYQKHLSGPQLVDNQGNSGWLQTLQDLINAGGKLDDNIYADTMEMKTCSKCENGNFVQNQFPHCPPGWAQTTSNPCDVKPIDETMYVYPDGVGIDDQKLFDELSSDYPAEIDEMEEYMEEENNDIMKYAMIGGVVLIVYLLATRK